MQAPNEFHRFLEVTTMLTRMEYFIRSSQWANDNVAYLCRLQISVLFRYLNYTCTAALSSLVSRFNQE